MISAALAVEIRRLHLIEGWRPNTIAHHLQLHHGTVTRVLVREGLRATTRSRRTSILDPFLPFVRETLVTYPGLAASVLFEMIEKRGYRGGEDHFRHRLAGLGLRPRKAPEAFSILRTLPGEQAQVDWADFGERAVPGGVRRLFAFVLVASYSRFFFVRFFYGARLPSFLAGHALAFEFLGGAPRTLLYDNLKSAVLERQGPAIRFHPRLLELADHYGFEPRPVAPYRGNEKGRVERTIRYLRGSWFPLRHDWSLEALNPDVLDWCRGRAAQRAWPQDRRRTVASAFAEERPRLLPLPANRFPFHETIGVIARRTPFLTFDANRYGIPSDRIDRPLTVHADLDRVRILDGTQTVADHQRSWSKQQIIENKDFTDALWKSKEKARLHRGQSRLVEAVPRVQEFLGACAKRQLHLAGVVIHLVEMLAEFGPAELRSAIDETLAAGVIDISGVRLILDRHRHHRGRRPSLPIALPDDPRIRNLAVQPHSLDDYDPRDCDTNNDGEVEKP